MAVTEVEKEPGSRRNSLGAVDALKLAMLVTWAMWAAAAVEPRRVLTKVTAALAAMAALFGWLVTSRLDLAVLAAVAAVVGLVVLTLPVMVLGEAALARSADRVWVARTATGRAYGRVAAKGDGSWELSSMAAWPFKGKTGSLVRDRACAAADQAGIPVVRLTADTDDLATRFYGPAGWVTVGHTRLRQPQMERRFDAVTGSAEQRRGDEASDDEAGAVREGPAAG